VKKNRESSCFLKRRKALSDLRLDRNRGFVLGRVTATLQGERAEDKTPVNI
jgi:hypothetical protein